MSLDEVIVYPIPAALYLVKNLLQYYIFAYVDAPGYQILKNLNIISTGVLYQIILKKKLSEIQWAAFILLCAGCTIAQLDSSSDRVLQTPFQGWMMAIVMALLSGFAGVYTEAIIKKRPSRNINVQNIWLYVFGMAFNAIAILIQDFDAVMNKGFFHGYTLITTLMILNHALSGIAVSMVMKYADNIVKGMAHKRRTTFCVFYFCCNASHGSRVCFSFWISSLPHLLPRLNGCLGLDIFALYREAAKIMFSASHIFVLPVELSV
ncbi:hypothetical protein HHK36_002407 [Tetracentron sinense]|uniref:CMP-sialic acid transporter n=1 Tax=Tetracentron sinense TaxID=13715 RepID=A0A834ZLG4_TETSI|nr:hypothetical protein HHK36_002407 [Tetracentron sinense]